MKGLIIIGSAAKGSHTNALAQYLQGQFSEQDIDAEIFDLAEKPLHSLDFSGAAEAPQSYKDNIKACLLYTSDAADECVNV